MKEVPKIEFMGTPDITRIEKCISDILSARTGRTLTVKLRDTTERAVNE